jgi:hypothetical protein
MDKIKLKECIDVLRPCAQLPDSLNALAKAEELINEYFRDEAAALTRAIDAETNKRVRGEDWSRMRRYVQTCLDRLVGAIDEGRLRD